MLLAERCAPPGVPTLGCLSNDHTAGRPPWAGALAGVAAAAAALGVGEIAAGLAGVASPVVGVGDQVIRTSPGTFARWGIDTFGTADKPALVMGIVAVALLLGGVLGAASVRRRAPGVLGIAAFGVIGAVAVAEEPGSSTVGAVVALAVAAAAGIATLLVLLAAAPASATSLSTAGASPSTATADRRRFLLGGGAVLAAAGITAALGRTLASRAAATASRAALALPRPARRAAAVPAGASIDVPGLSPVITPNAVFYRIDERLAVPYYEAEGWTLRVHGMVDRPFELTMDEVLALPMVEEHVTLACVSNEVGGDLVGTATWLGHPLGDLLGRARVRPGADQVVGRAVDGFTAGFPLAAATDGRTALVCVGMNGEPLPHGHGFPLRLVVAGLYGYVSATKWLTDIELTTFAATEAYWVRRGWAARAPIKPQSRIDTPRPGARLPRGRTAVAGVAWAPTAGVAAVEVQADGDRWRPARLADAISGSTWRQWVYEWDAPSGRHTLAVRATTTAGEVQTGERAEPFPDGATGWHTVTVDVA